MPGMMMMIKELNFGDMTGAGVSERVALVVDTMLGPEELTVGRGSTERERLAEVGRCRWCENPKVLLESDRHSPAQRFVPR